MKLAVQIFGYGGMILGVFAILGSLASGVDGGPDAYGVVGGFLFFILGFLPVLYIYQESENEA